MDKDDFIDAVYLAVYRTTVDAVMQLLSDPPGRRPRPDVAALSAWYNSSDESTQGGVREAVRLSVEQAVFGMLAALDGARALGTNVEVSLSDGAGNELTADHDLHDLFRSLVDSDLGREAR